MENLWAPWRIDYILGRKPEGCIFCDKPAEKKDEDNFILYRGKHHFIILNAFPYNNGHMMVVPYRHTATLSAWAPEEQQEMMQLADICVELLRECMRPDGFNLGINMGLVGGAGVADHIHLHIVPRWNGDTNFMPVLSDTRVISEALQATYKKLKEALDGLIETKMAILKEDINEKAEKRQHCEESQKMEQKYNAIGWFEIPVTDMERAVRFYEQVFDIKLTRQQVGPLEMAWFPWVGTGLGATGSLVYNKEFYKPSRDGVLVYFTAHSGDLAVELSRVEAAGGEVLVPKKLIRNDIGYMAVVLDSEGNRIALHSIG